jgi:hypothetical protein
MVNQQTCPRCARTTSQLWAYGSGHSQLCAECFEEQYTRDRDRHDQALNRDSDWHKSTLPGLAQTWARIRESRGR